jgi:hypothetical protein
MLRINSALGRVSVVFVGLSLLALQGSVRGQVVAPGELDASLRVMHADGAINEVTTPEVAATVIVGQVIGPDGAPAAGAVVVSSAGGQAVTDAEGAFSLEVEVPVGADSVRVTAVMGSGTGSLVGSVQVGGLTAWGATSAGTLVLEQAATCQPSWSALGSGIAGWVFSLSVFDDGSGPALYAGGAFTTAGGVSANCIAKWNGTTWSALGSGINGGYVYALTVFDDGSGPALYAGGIFTSAGGSAANSIAKWNGTSWSALGSGMDYWVQALTVFDDGSGPALYAGGEFSTAGGVAAQSIAKWGGCSPPPSPWTNLGSGLAGISGIPQLNGSGELLAGTPGKIRLVDAAPSAPAALFISAANTPTPFKGGTLLTVPVLLTLPLPTDPMGDILLPWTAWPPGLSGVSLYFQFGIKDLAAVKGVALSNALGADVP